MFVIQSKGNSVHYFTISSPKTTPHVVCHFETLDNDKLEISLQPKTFHDKGTSFAIYTRM